MAYQPFGSAGGRGAWRQPVKQSLVPTLLLAAVLAVGLTLIMVVTLRPWASANTAYDTHLNLREEAPASYSRTADTWVETTPGAPKGWTASRVTPEAAYGYALFAGRGCAGCHGLSAQGGVGPSLLGDPERKIAKLVRDGTGGMPTYHDTELTQAELNAIMSYIFNLGPEPTETPVKARPTPTPYPTATPIPTPTPTPTPTPVPGVTPTPTPTPTPKPTLSPGEMKDLQNLFRAVGCDICHGSLGEGITKGPKLRDLTRDEIIQTVRNGKRTPGSVYPRAMEAVSLSDLSDQELDQIIKFLQNQE